ncbi:MAG: hypothetical protein AAF502_18570 [Bacteroidota bacterium]
MRFTLTFLFICCFFLANGQIVRTVHQSFEKEQAHLLELDLKANVEIQEWTGSRILVETTISLEGANKNIIEALIDAGRYHLEKTENGQSLLLNFKNLQNKLAVRSIEIYETIRVKIFVPEGMQYDESLAAK